LEEEDVGGRAFVKGFLTGDPWNSGDEGEGEEEGKVSCDEVDPTLG